MPDPKFVKPWQGIPRQHIKWQPIIDRWLKTTKI
jgi:hypothetical protein